MNNRKLRSAWHLFWLVFIIVTIYLYSRRTTYLGITQDHGIDETGPSSIGALSNPSVLSTSIVATYLNSIMDREDMNLPRLECPRPDLSRYEYLKSQKSTKSSIQYFFALNLRECLPILPRLLGSLIEAIHFLGPENCAVSIVEGNSGDGTAEVLAALYPRLAKLLNGRVFFTLENDIRPLEGEGQRFKKLADLRNMALQPMLINHDQYLNATVVFINDVAICFEDILELIHQRLFLGSDMTCAFDWTYGDSAEPIFYDSYIARSINGDLFFDIPAETASYSLAEYLFWNEPHAQARFKANQPFQVFSCWNGAVAFTATPIVLGKVSFRAALEKEGECYQGEPQLFCKDMWFQGYGKIAVIPSINLEYSNENGKKIKADKGYTSQWVSKDGSTDEKIDWQPPPDLVKCMPTFTDQTWHPWNETLV